MLEQTSRRISVEWDESALPTSKIERILSSFPPEDPEDPRNFSRRTKVSAAVLCSLMTYLVTFATSEYTGAYGALVREFEASSEVVILGLSLMLIGFSVGPLLLSPLSEIFGRKPIMFISSVCFCLWQLGPALAQNIETILVSRFFMGLMGSAPLSVSAGVIADLYDPASRGPMMAMFALAPLMGPVTGPIVGGASMIDIIRFILVLKTIIITGSSSCSEWNLVALDLLDNIYSIRIGCFLHVLCSRNLCSCSFK